jgi:hypothetical protein
MKQCSVQPQCTNVGTYHGQFSLSFLYANNLLESLKSKIYNLINLGIYQII